MGWRTVVVTGNAKLEYKLDYLVIRKLDSSSKIHLSEIKMLIVESTSASLTTMLLSELNKNKIKVIFCDEKHNPHSELVSYYGSHDTSAKIKKQIEWTKENKGLIWTEIIGQKIRNQALHLDERGLKEQSQLLYDYLDELEFADATNREGHAAKVYFNALFGKDFSRSQDNGINAALNYGYGILLSFFNREIVANGYMTQIGVFHDNMFNQFNLASDLLEPFRILIDRKVFEMDHSCFEVEEKHEILGIFSEEIYIDNRIQFFPNAISIYCRSVFDAINENDPSLIKFFKYEL